MTAVRLERIRLRVLQGVDLRLASGELFVLLGQSGAGKTTLLEVIAGLLPYEGRVRFDGVAIDHLPPRRRRVGYLFQDLLLFPHLNVRRNLALAMLHRGLTRTARDAEIRDLLERFGIWHLRDRYPDQMSGGEQQRAALARSMATCPRILLLDEPFSSLDPGLVQDLCAELKAHQRRLGITTLFVTHNREEARRLADRIGIMEGGRLEDQGPLPPVARMEKARVTFPTEEKAPQPPWIFKSRPEHG
jgi:ABC-type Fe3+/spermidine/putrescine transport system ATPase subunit